jgi:hypothetical protein
MACSSCSPSLEQYGAEPVNVQWKVVRGSNGSLTIDFLEIDEDTPFDTDNWTYKATSYDPQGNVLDNLPVEATTGAVTITVDSCITENWGLGYKNIVAELPFDLQVTIPAPTVSGGGYEDPTIWTPVIGTICVLGNVTPGGSL